MRASLLLRLRMRLVIHAQQMFHRELRVTLCSREPLMAQHLLNRAQVSAFFEHVRAERMAQRVRMNVRRQAFSHSYFLDYPANAARREAPPASVNEQRGCVLVRLRKNRLTS